MFYGKSGDNTGGPKGGRSDRFQQMTKQQQLIEQKKREIQAKIEAEKHKKAMEELLKTNEDAVGPGSSSTSKMKSETSSGTNSGSTSSPSVVNVFSNDGSFLEKFRKMQEEQKRKSEEEEKASTQPTVSTTTVKEERIDPIEGHKDGRRSSSSRSHGHEKQNSHSQDWSESRSRRNDSDSESRNNAYRGATPGNNNFAPPDFYHHAPPPPPPPPPPPMKKENQGDEYEYGSRNFAPESQLKFHNNQAASVAPPQKQSSFVDPLLKSSAPPQQYVGFPSPAVKALAARVAEQGDELEKMTRENSKHDPLLWFLHKPDSTEYRKFRDLVQQLKLEQQKLLSNLNLPTPGVTIMNSNTALTEYGSPSFPDSPSSSSEPTLKRSASSDEEDRKEKKRRSRWGPQSGSVAPPSVAMPGVSNPLPVGPVAGVGSLPGVATSLPVQPPMEEFVLAGRSHLVTKVTRKDPQLLAYARQSYGTIDLDEEQWKQCEEAYKMNLLFQDLQRKKLQDDKLERAGKFKYEYDSDEDAEDGTWEHKKREKEMERTKKWADELTQQAKGKHHIGDFLPPDELNKFMEKYKAVKEGRRLEDSEYQEYKIQKDNIGFKMLEKMGWADGKGLGATEQGIVAPVNKANVPADKQGLGVEKPNDLTEEDDEYTAYRKRMMLAYRFRPNPLNNPRRAYY